MICLYAEREVSMKYIKQIENYNTTNEQEVSDKKIILDFIDRFKHNILTRENEIAHMTCSGFVMNKGLNKVLMIHHNIYNTWAWTGGHADSEEDLLVTAIKEANEETGVNGLMPLFDEIASIDILPVWGHYKRGNYVSAHLHLNVSYILIGDENEELIINENETSGVKWIDIDEIDEYSNEPELIEVYYKLIDRAKQKA